MNVARGAQRAGRAAAGSAWLVALAVGMACGMAAAQTSDKTDASAGKVVGDNPGASKAQQPGGDAAQGKAVGDAATQAESAPQSDAAQVQILPSLELKPEGRKRSAWGLLQEAVNDGKHPQTQIHALAALGMLRCPDSERLIGNAMLDSDVDVRTAAALAAGQSRDPNLTSSLRNLLDDKEPQVAFTAAMTLAKMGDRSGEDILMAVVDGDRKAEPGILHGTQHKISRDLHNPGKLARLGAVQGAAMLLGPFGFGITALEFMRQSGGDTARAAAIEQIAQEKTEPIHHELVDALKDKDPGVRAAAAKALIDYHDQSTRDAVYTLLLDPKDPARLTGAAAYLRLTGVPGPLPQKPARTAVRPRRSMKSQ